MSARVLSLADYRARREHALAALAAARGDVFAQAFADAGASALAMQRAGGAIVARTEAEARQLLAEIIGAEAAAAAVFIDAANASSPRD